MFHIISHIKRFIERYLVSGFYLTVSNLSTFLNIYQCVTVLFITVLWSVFALSFGFYTEFLKYDTYPGGVKNILFTILRLLFIPSFVEEFIYRGLLQNHIYNNIYINIFYIIFINIIYTLSHIIITKIIKKYKNTFDNYRFLILAFFMGNICSFFIYFYESLYPCIFLHWLTVSVWILALGGWRVIFNDIQNEEEIDI
eukprot:GHVL01020004.1.p2 GENE.GHVL01020004.1~~GHVL01020004.1.p2  ORF type:complete len:198 (+),score=51.95 GHVL01020004.1:1133-1726(+)